MHCLLGALTCYFLFAPAPDNTEKQLTKPFVTGAETLGAGAQGVATGHVASASGWVGEGSTHSALCRGPARPGSARGGERVSAAHQVFRQCCRVMLRSFVISGSCSCKVSLL